jgi:hypothetical protein
VSTFHTPAIVKLSNELHPGPLFHDLGRRPVPGTPVQWFGRHQVPRVGDIVRLPLRERRRNNQLANVSAFVVSSGALSFIVGNPDQKHTAPLWGGGDIISNLGARTADEAVRIREAEMCPGDAAEAEILPYMAGPQWRLIVDKVAADPSRPSAANWTAFCDMVGGMRTAVIWARRHCDAQCATHPRACEDCRVCAQFLLAALALSEDPVVLAHDTLTECLEVPIDHQANEVN